MRTAEHTLFLRRQPAAYTRALSLVLVSLCATVAYFAVAVELPDAVVAPFSLRPPTSRAALTVPTAGVVTRVLAQEGDRIAAAQVLVRVSAPGAADALVARLRLEQRREDLRRLDGSKTRALEVFDARSRALDPVVLQHEASIPLLRQAAGLVIEQSARAEQLRRHELLAATGLSEAKVNEVRAKLALAAEESALAAARAERARIRAERDLEEEDYERRRRELEDELASLTSALSGQRGMLEFAEGDDLVVRAPCDGTVAEQRVAGNGSSVSSGDVLMLVHCDEDVLHASVLLPQSKSPLVKVGQRVKLMYDALPYQRWGVRYGSVRRVAPVSDREGRFVADVELDEQVIETSTGRIEMRPGMSGTARVVVGRRTLLDHALAPLRGLREKWLVPRRERIKMDMATGEHEPS